MLVSPARAVANDDEAGIEQETPTLHQRLFHLAIKQMAQDSFIMALSFFISCQAPALSLFWYEDASSFILFSLHSFHPHSVLCFTNTHIFTGLYHFASPFILKLCLCPAVSALFISCTVICCSFPSASFSALFVSMTHIFVE